MKTILALLLSGYIAVGFCQLNVEMQKKFEILFDYNKKDQISVDNLKECTEIMKTLKENKYYEYIDSIKNNTVYVSQSLTKTYANLCIKCGGEFGVNSYLDYLEMTSGSAEEERSMSLERLFMAYPEIVLEKTINNKSLLDHIVWGFLNNRYNGPKYIENKEIKERMTVDNYERFFYETNPKLKELYSKYKEQIDYILSQAKLGFE